MTMTNETTFTTPFCDKNEGTTTITETVVRDICVNSFSSEFGSKFYLNGLIGGKSVNCIIDSGAEISLVAPKFVNSESMERLDNAINVRGFQLSGAVTKINYAATIDFDFYPVVLKAKFMICETNQDVAIIGADILRDLNLETGFNTVNECFTLKGVGLKTTQNMLM